MAKITSVNISKERGRTKHPVKSIRLVADHGIFGDAHADGGIRQVSLLGEESIQKIKSKAPDIHFGAFAENIDTTGITLYTLPVGTLLRVGTALCRVTQIGKQCHHGCAIREITGDCVMPREGIFVAVIKDGRAAPGDEIVIIDES